MNELTPKPQGFFENVPSKFTFIFGLVIGIAAFSLFGYISLLSRVSADGTVKTTNNASANSNTGGQVAGDTNNSNSAQAAPVSVKPVSDADYIRGNKDAKVTLLEYSDLECPYCKTFHETVQQVMSAYPNDVRIVHRHFPLSFHVNAAKEAEAAECVAEQGGSDAYWKFIDAIYTRTTSNGTGFALDKLAPLAKEVGVDQTKFTSCLDTGKYTEKVNTDLSEGSAAGVSGTPTSFVLDEAGNVVETIPGALSFAQVDTIIKSALGK
jgi:protein-disulfide isomerase